MGGSGVWVSGLWGRVLGFRAFRVSGFQGFRGSGRWGILRYMLDFRLLLGWGLRVSGFRVYARLQGFLGFRSLAFKWGGGGGGRGCWLHLVVSWFRV